ncbi:MAG TPA: GNAT family N-acetyltransferase, partial [Chloroflexi bacterium]|nr:GNAT family N-acetyltransferase [Chloroflexota bacterium]
MNPEIKIRAATWADQPSIVDFLRQMNLRGEDILIPGTRYWLAQTA